LCLFLQGASGDVQPVDALNEESGKEVAFGRRVALEALHAVADADPWPRIHRRELLGRWTPTAVYRAQPAPDAEEQTVAVRVQSVELPLVDPPSVPDLRDELGSRQTARTEASANGAPRSVTNGIDNQIRWLQTWLTCQETGQVPRSVAAEVWATRIGEGSIVGISAEPFAAIGNAIRSASPASATLVAGCCGSVAGYIPVPEEYEAGGFEVAMSHRIYDLPAGIGPAGASRVQAVAAELLAELFPDGDGAGVSHEGLR
jgi:hypothetical protein